MQLDQHRSVPHGAGPRWPDRPGLIVVVAVSAVVVAVVVVVGVVGVVGVVVCCCFSNEKRT